MPASWKGIKDDGAESVSRSLDGGTDETLAMPLCQVATGIQLQFFPKDKYDGGVNVMMQLSSRYNINVNPKNTSSLCCLLKVQVLG